MDTTKAAVDAVRNKAMAWYRGNLQHLYKVIGAHHKRCRSCGRDMWMVPTRLGNMTPFTMDGRPHFEDCPQAEEHRKKKR